MTVVLVGSASHAIDDLRPDAENHDVLGICISLVVSSYVDLHSGGFDQDPCNHKSVRVFSAACAANLSHCVYLSLVVLPGFLWLSCCCVLASVCFLSFLFCLFVCFCGCFAVCGCVLCSFVLFHCALTPSLVVVLCAALPALTLFHNFPHRSNWL